MAKPNVCIIAFENKPYQVPGSGWPSLSAIIGGNGAPAKYAWHQGYYDTGDPSCPNYGSMAFGTASLTPSDTTAYNLTNSSVYGRLTNASIHWEAYFEGVTLANFFTNTADSYVFKHNPVGFCHPYNGSLDTSSPYTGAAPTAFYSNANGSKFANAGSVGTAFSTSGSISNFSSSSTFSTMLASMHSSTPASFYWGGPCLTNQAHGGTHAAPWAASTGSTAGVPDADAFAAYMVQQIMTTAWYKNHGNIILWWDEGNHPPTLAQTNLVIINEGGAKAKGAIGSSTQTLDHNGLVYDLLTAYGLFAIGSATSQPGSISGVLDLAATTLVPTSLSFLTAPATTVSGVAFSPAPQVQVLDQNGSPISTSTPITLAVASGTGTLSGVTMPVTAVNGVATFTGLILTGTAGSFTLTATTTSSGVAAVTSPAFTLAASAGTASKLAITSQPTTGAPGVALSPAFVVQLQDSTGAPVSSSGVTVVAALSLNPTSDTLGGTTSVTTSATGLASFSNLIVHNASTSPYTIQFTSSGLTSATTAQFTITIPVTQPGVAKGIVGLIDPFGDPKTTLSLPATSSYMNALSGFVPQGSIAGRGGISWAELQPTSFGPIATNNPIDTAIAAVRTQMAVAGQSRQWYLKLRIFTGESSVNLPGAPAWALARGGGPVIGPGVVGSTQVSMGAWWTAEWLAAWKDFMTKLAALYDAVPEIGEVVCSIAGTVTAEPLLKTDYMPGSTPGNANALLTGVYTTDWTWALEKANEQNAATFMQSVWQNTPSEVSFNPADVISSGTRGGATPDETFTESLMDYVVANVPKSLGVLGNGNLRANGTSGVSGLAESIDVNGNVTDGHGTVYGAMLTHLLSLGQKSVAPGLPAGSATKCIGLFDRQGIHTNSSYSAWPQAAFNGVLGGFVIGNNPLRTTDGINWSDLQPALGSGAAGTGEFTTNGLVGGTKSSAAAAIDFAFGQADAYNHANPTAIQWTLKLRLLLGESAPTWAQTLDTQITGNGYTTWSWWTANALACWKNLQQKLAAYVPAYTVAATGLANTRPLAGHPLLGEIEQSLCMTHYEEPLLKLDFNGTTSPTLASLGYTWALEQAQHQAAVAYMPYAWPGTNWNCAFNPAQALNGTGSYTTDETFTESLMDYVAANGGAHALIGNDSVRTNGTPGLVYPSSTTVYADTHNTDYTSMYTHMASYGQGSAVTGTGAHPQIAGIVAQSKKVPFYLQTASMTTLGGTLAYFLATLDYAVWLGARMVELPATYNTVAATTDLSPYYAKLLANDPTTTAPALLAYQTQPLGAVQGATLASVVVMVTSASGKQTTTGTGTVTVALGVGSGLSGTLTQPLVNGVATFSDLAISATGTADTLVATSSVGYTSITSAPFAITSSAGIASQLVIAQAPPATGTAPNSVPYPFIAVEVADSSGVRVTSSTATITVALGTSPTGATLFPVTDPDTGSLGSLAEIAISGLATWNDIEMDTAGTYTLVFTSPGLQSVTTSQFAVSTVVARNPLQQPFTSTSIWNQPIGSNATYVGATLTPGTLQSMTQDAVIVLMDYTQPSTKCETMTDPKGNRCTTDGTLQATVPMSPYLVIPSSGHNYGMTCVESDNTSMLQGAPFARCVQGGNATWRNLHAAQDLSTSDGLTGSKGGSGLSILGGLIRLGELVPGGGLPHALAVNLNAGTDMYYPKVTDHDAYGTVVPTGNGFRWPANTADSYASSTTYAGTNPAVQEGSLLALKPTFNISALTTIPAQMIAHALQDYGAYVVNDSTRAVNVLCLELGPPKVSGGGYNDVITEFQNAWGFSFLSSGYDNTPWAKDIDTIWAALCVINNNGPASIGGGGTPRQPLAPPAG